MKLVFITICVSIALANYSPAKPTPIETKLDSWSRSKVTPVARLNKLYEIAWDYSMVTYPEWATYLGYPGQNDRWTDLSFEAIAQRKQENRAFLKALTSVSEKGLAGEDLLNYRLFKFRLEEEISSFQFPEELLPVNQMGGVQSDLADLFIVAPKRNIKDYEDMLLRLQRASIVLAQTESLMREGLKLGVTYPKVTLAGLPQQFDKLLTPNVGDSPIYVAFAKIQRDIPDDQKERIQQQARRIIGESVFPALKKLRDFVVQEYIPKCRDSIAWSDLPKGKAWYNTRIRKETTLEKTADEIHQLGLEEVARINKEMEKIRNQLQFKGSVQKFNELLKDPKFTYSKSEDLLAGYRSLSKDVDAELPKFFGRLPRLTYGIKEIPSFKAPTSPAVYYEEGSLQAGRAGYFVANTYDLSARPKWAMMDLTCHEAVPGHHLQISLAKEIEGLPEFRKNIGYTSYVEGWALYGEGLCDEMGLYKDPYSKYGQLADELWRALRLVVDTGIHSKGWSRDQVVSYLREAGPFAEQEIQSETDRYIVWAGQALAYKIGELKIKEIRNVAKAALGDKFDIREFHDEVLGSGPLPLPVLEKKIEDWIRQKLKKKAVTR